MAGRGRAATLPSWMTAGAVEGSSVVTTPSISNISAPPPSSSPKIAPQISISTSLTASSSANAVSTAQSSVSSSFTSTTSPRQVQQSTHQPISLPVPVQIPQQFNPASTVAPSTAQHYIQSPYSNWNNGAGMPMLPYGVMPNYQMQQQIPQQQHQQQGNMYMPSVQNHFNMQQQKAMPPLGPPPTNSSSNQNTVMDPNNDVSAWSEHNTEDGRKYWYNRITASSTYDKPFCLKTPEERSIPPCPWKEYVSPEGKKYYSNGTESLWNMPEEFKIWKERVENAIARKAANATSSLSGPLVNTSASLSTDSATASVSRAADAVTDKHVDTASEARRAARPVKSTDAGGDDGDDPIYATKEEAREAFLALLDDKHITSSMRMKEVQDLCHTDKRWNALKGGDKKQELAEYQTRKLKIEKEQQKIKNRKCRDAFLLMLAEKVEIDARTRWRDAVEILQHESRYKNVEDPRDREEIFNDFVLELEKKEREDRAAKRDNAKEKFDQILLQMKTDGQLSRKSIWADHKAEFVELLIKDTDLRALEDVDARRYFQDFVDRLESDYRQQRKAKRIEVQKLLDEKLIHFRQLLEQLALEGKVDHNSRWKELVAVPEIKQSAVYQEITRLLNSEDKENSAESLGVVGDPRDVFSRFQQLLSDASKADKSLVKDTLAQFQLVVEVDTNFADFKAVVHKIAGVKEINSSLIIEEGEEIDDISGLSSNFDVSKHPLHYTSKTIPSYLRILLLRRPCSLQQVFNQLHVEAVEIKAEEDRKQRKREDRFNDLLEDYFYRSDHVDIKWEDAKRDLEDHKAYFDLSREDRKRLFAKHMEVLKKRLDSKTKSMKETTTNNVPYRDLNAVDYKVGVSLPAANGNSTSHKDLILGDTLVDDIVGVSAETTVELAASDDGDSDDDSSNDDEAGKHKKSKKHKKKHHKRKREEDRDKSSKKIKN